MNNDQAIQTFDATLETLQGILPNLLGEGTEGDVETATEQFNDCIATLQSVSATLAAAVTTLDGQQQS